VALVVALLRKALLATAAVEGLLACMCAHMRLEIPCLLEVVITIRAYMLLQIDPRTALQRGARTFSFGSLSPLPRGNGSFDRGCLGELLSRLLGLTQALGVGLAGRVAVQPSCATAGHHGVEGGVNWEGLNGG
jgi:hypothetical protein